MKRPSNSHGDRKRGVILAILITAGLIAAALVVYIIGTNLERAEQTSSVGETEVRTPGVPIAPRDIIEIEGVQYAPRRNLTSILIIGVDKAEEDESQEIAFRSGGQADYLTVMAIDDTAKELKRINIDRDTMADITVLSALGKPKGTRLAQISLSHGYGADREQAAEFTFAAVENLLLGVDIDFYLSFSMDAINAMNDLVGGVTVRIEEDLTAIDPAFEKGSLVTLSGEQAERFVRARKNVSDGTNLQRMQRQNAFMSAFFDLVAEKLREDTSFVNRLLDTLSPHMASNMRRGRMVNEAYKARNYAAPAPLVLQGQRRVNANNNLEFHPDEASLQRAVIDTFFQPLPSGKEAVTDTGPDGTSHINIP